MLRAMTLVYRRGSTKAKDWEHIPKIAKARIRVSVTGIMLVIIFIGLSLGFFGKPYIGTLIIWAAQAMNLGIMSHVLPLQWLPSLSHFISTLAHMSRSLASRLSWTALSPKGVSHPECHSSTPIQDWEITMMKAGDDGKLIPIEYTLNHPTAHTLSVIDVDAKDMAMAFWLDNKIHAATPKAELNKSENCGEDYAECMRRGFSCGTLLIPKGNHTVRVVWNGVGKWHRLMLSCKLCLTCFSETPGPDGNVDWGEEGGRRLAWRRDSCSV